MKKVILSTIAALFALAIIISCSSSDDTEEVIETFLTTLSKTSLDFGSVDVNTSATLNFVVTNTGNQEISITNISTPTGFSIDKTSEKIQPGNNTTFTITFSPTEAKSYTGDITITSNSDSASKSIAVSGNGIAFVETITHELTPNSLSFGDVTVNTTDSKSFSIKNTGNTNLVITDIVATPSIYSVNETTATIAPGNTKTISVTFSPDQEIVYAGTVQITSNSTTTANAVAVSGTGVAVTPVPTYETDIKPIITQNCSTTGCHDSSARAGVDLSDYAKAKSGFGGRAWTRLDAGTMPPASRAAVSASDKAKIKEWIDGDFPQ